MTYHKSGAARDRRHRLGTPKGMSLNKCRECGAFNPSALGEPIPKTCVSCGSDLAQEITVTDKTFEPINRDGNHVRRPRQVPRALTHKKVRCQHCGHTFFHAHIEPEPPCPACQFTKC